MGAGFFKPFGWDCFAPQAAWLKQAMGCGLRGPDDDGIPLGGEASAMSSLDLTGAIHRACRRRRPRSTTSSEPSTSTEFQAVGPLQPGEYQRFMQAYNGRPIADY